MNLERRIKNLERKYNWPDSDSVLLSHKWDDQEKEEVERLRRIDEIREEANNARIARCEAKMKEVGEEKFMNLIHHYSGGEGWSDYEGRTEIEEEYWKLSKEQHDVNWYRDHGKAYREEDDPQAKFGENHTKEEWAALEKRMETNRDINTTKEESKGESSTEW